VEVAIEGAEEERETKKKKKKKKDGKHVGMMAQV